MSLYLQFMSMVKSLFKLFFVSFLVFTGTVFAQELDVSKNPLLPIKTDNPRETMKSFMNAMNAYRHGVKEHDSEDLAKINSAMRCLDLSTLPVLGKEEKGKAAAIYLKEVMDRVIVIDYEKIPEKSETTAPLLRWRLRNTEIVINKILEGDRAGEYLFSAETVERAPEFFEKVKHLPYLPNSGEGAAFKVSRIDDYIPSWGKDKYFVLETWQWIAIVIFIFIGLTIKVVVRHSLGFFSLFLRKGNVQFGRDLMEAALGPTGYILAAIFWVVSLQLLRLDGESLTFFKIILKVFLSANVIWLAYRITGVLTEFFARIAAKTESTLDDHLVPLLSRTLKIFVVVLGLLFTAQNLGFNVMSLVAGLGIGGFAFALAAKDTVANFFGSLMVLFDNPFEVGDWIVVGGSEGTVEEIGFRSTRVRTFYNSQISIPNSELMNASIDNMGRREYRRVLTRLGVTYDTSPQKLEAFLEGIKNIILANPYSRKDYLHVVFNEFGDSSLVILLYFFLKVPGYSHELLARQNIFLEILRLAEKLDVAFAFPTQTLHVETFPEKKPTRTSLDPSDMPDIAKSFSESGKNAKPDGLGIFHPPFKK